MVLYLRRKNFAICPLKGTLAAQGFLPPEFVNENMTEKDGVRREETPEVHSGAIFLVKNKGLFPAHLTQV